MRYRKHLRYRTTLPQPWTNSPSSMTRYSSVLRAVISVAKRPDE